MKYELSYDDKARVVAMYLNADVLYICEGEEVICHIENVGLNNLSATGRLKDGKTFNHYGHNLSGKLLLIPLSEITDVHILELVKICGLANAVIRERDEFGVVIKDDSYGFWISYEGYLSMYKNDKLYHMNMLPCYDQLREWNYALPYKGVDLFKSGLAMSKKKIDRNSI